MSGTAPTPVGLYEPAPDDPLAPQHQLLNDLLVQAPWHRWAWAHEFQFEESEAGKTLRAQGVDGTLGAISALLRRLSDLHRVITELEAGSRTPWEIPGRNDLCMPRVLFRRLLARFLAQRPVLSADQIASLQDYLGQPGELHEWLRQRPPWLINVIRVFEISSEQMASDRRLREGVVRLIAGLRGYPQYYKDVQKLADRLSLMLAGVPGVILEPGEVWSEVALGDLATMEAAERPSWRDLLAYCQRMCAGKLTGRWLNDARRWHAAVGPASFKARVLRWFPLVDRTRPESIGRSVDDGSRDLPIPKPHSDLLRGLAWCCVLQPDRDLVRALGNLALSAYRKVPRRGPRAVALGNACIAALGMMEEAEVLGQLVVLRSRIKFGTARKEIGKALETTAMRLGLPPEEVEELGVPDYGLTEVGRLAVPMGAFTAELTVADDGATTLAWRAPGGTPQKTVPAAVKQSHAEALKELKATARDIEAMTAAQRDRIDNLFLARKSWPLEAWRQRYMDHPIVGRIARRLLWTFTTAGRTTDGIVHEGQIVGRDDRPIEGLGPGTSVALWHPIDHATDEVLAWRSWLEAHGVRQPFKQAHREVYVLTEAERQTRVYSNRFAAHVLRQHQFNALCGVRGWKNQLRLMVDDTYPPATLHLPRWGLRAEFWVEGAGDAYGRDTTETGTYLHLTTDQVRFYPIAAAQRFAHAGGGGYHRGPRADDDEPMALEDVPALVVSEVMRDVDLFVGVASVGNDPTWSDGGPEGRYVDYWRSYSFGDLSATAQTRKSVLQRLIPRLKIADRCSLGDRFLVVRGDLRTYKIHLGSGNILMEPGDEYLCIVPKQAPAGAGASPVFLPFEGDATLAIIVSKALLLAEDRKITDRTITSQIRRGL